MFYEVYTLLIVILEYLLNIKWITLSGVRFPSLQKGSKSKYSKLKHEIKNDYKSCGREKICIRQIK